MIKFDRSNLELLYLSKYINMMSSTECFNDQNVDKIKIIFSGYFTGLLSRRTCTKASNYFPCMKEWIHFIQWKLNNNSHSLPFWLFMTRKSMINLKYQMTFVTFVMDDLDSVCSLPFALNWTGVDYIKPGTSLLLWNNLNPSTHKWPHAK